MSETKRRPPPPSVKPRSRQGSQQSVIEEIPDTKPKPTPKPKPKPPARKPKPVIHAHFTNVSDDDDDDATITFADEPVKPVKPSAPPRHHGTHPKESPSTSPVNEPVAKVRKSPPTRPDKPPSPRAVEPTKPARPSKPVSPKPTSPLSHEASASLPSSTKQPERPARPVSASSQGHIRPAPTRPAKLPPSNNTASLPSPTTTETESPARPDRPTKPTKPLKPSRPNKTAPARPAPAVKPARPAPVQKPKPGGPSLPPRPKPGHPLYKYMVTGPKAVVLFDWEPEVQTELPLQVGSIIKLHKWVNPEWLQGEDASGRVGTFPAVFVDVEEDVPIVGPQAVAIKDFEAEFPHEISLATGDNIGLTAILDDDWFRASFRGMDGAIPRSFVEIVVPFNAPAPRCDWPSEWLETAAAVEDGGDELAQTVLQAQTFSTAQPHAIALYDYDSTTEGDLSFKTGDTVLLIEKFGDNDEWMKGRVGDKDGMFPVAYVDVVIPLESNQPHPPQVDDVEDEEDEISATDDSQFESPSEPSVPSDSKPQIVPGSATITYEYSSDQPGDLNLAPIGATVTLLESLNDDWFMGELDGNQGMFPKTFVDVIQEPQVEQVLESTQKSDESSHSETPVKASRRKKFHKPTEQLSSEPESAPTSPQSGLVRADYAYDGTHENDLNFEAGAEIILLEKLGDDWMKGQYNGKEGIFPSNFVTIIQDIS